MTDAAPTTESKMLQMDETNFEDTIARINSAQSNQNKNEEFDYLFKDGNAKIQINFHNTNYIFDLSDSRSKKLTSILPADKHTMKAATSDLNSLGSFFDTLPYTIPLTLEKNDPKSNPTVTVYKPMPAQTVTVYPHCPTNAAARGLNILGVQR